MLIKIHVIGVYLFWFVFCAAVYRGNINISFWKIVSFSFLFCWLTLLSLLLCLYRQSFSILMICHYGWYINIWFIIIKPCTLDWLLFDIDDLLYFWRFLCQSYRIFFGETTFWGWRWWHDYFYFIWIWKVSGCIYHFVLGICSNRLIFIKLRGFHLFSSLNFWFFFLRLDISFGFNLFFVTWHCVLSVSHGI